MTSFHTLLSRGGLGLSAAALALTLAACGGAQPVANSASTASSAPAMSSASATSSAAASSTSAMSSMEMSVTTGGTSGAATGSSTAAETDHNDADVMFLQMMLPHHRGAIEMAQLAPSRAANAQVKELAAQIEAAQAPEIEQMTSWLQAWDMPEDPAATMTGMSSAPSSDGGMGGMDHGGMTMGKDGDMGMPGEMTAEQMTALQEASGAEFDRMFLELMIEHHSGAVDMAETELDAGVNTDALELAESIKTSQTQEIATMQQLLQTL